MSGSEIRCSTANLPPPQTDNSLCSICCSWRAVSDLQKQHILDVEQRRADEVQNVDEELALSEEEAPNAANTGGHRGVILQPGQLRAPKRLRTHSPPPSGWTCKPDIIMGDGATVLDVASANVFAHAPALAEPRTDGGGMCQCRFEAGTISYSRASFEIDACPACARAALHVRSGAIRDARVRHKWNSDYETVPMRPRPNKVTSDRQEQEEQFSTLPKLERHTLRKRKGALTAYGCKCLTYEILGVSADDRWSVPSIA